MKTKILFIIGICTIMCITSCQKEEQETTKTRQEFVFNDGIGGEIFKETVECESKVDDDGVTTTIEEKSLAAKGLSSYDARLYDIDGKYKISYRHLKQYNNSSCSWTSYVITAACIATANNMFYNAYASTAKQVQNDCEDLTGSYENATYITALEKYAKKYDGINFKITRKAFSQSKKETAIATMIDHLMYFRCPFIVIGTYKNKDGSKYGHYLIVSGINWTGNIASSTVSYTDCSKSNGLYFDENLRKKNLKTFMSEMIVPGEVKNYNMLFLKPILGY